MKTDNELLEQMLGDTNLKQAYVQVKHNKGACGIDGMDVYQLQGYLDEHLDEIKTSIMNRCSVITVMVLDLIDAVKWQHSRHWNT